MTSRLPSRTVVQKQLSPLSFAGSKEGNLRQQRSGQVSFVSLLLLAESPKDVRKRVCCHYCGGPSTFLQSMLCLVMSFLSVFLTNFFLPSLLVVFSMSCLFLLSTYLELLNENLMVSASDQTPSEPSDFLPCFSFYSYIFFGGGGSHGIADPVNQDAGGRNPIVCHRCSLFD